MKLTVDEDVTAGDADGLLSGRRKSSSVKVTISPAQPKTLSHLPKRPPVDIAFSDLTYAVTEGRKKSEYTVILHIPGRARPLGRFWRQSRTPHCRGLPLGVGLAAELHKETGLAGSRRGARTHGHAPCSLAEKSHALAIGLCIDWDLGLQTFAQPQLFVVVVFSTAVWYFLFAGWHAWGRGAADGVAAYRMCNAIRNARCRVSALLGTQRPKIARSSTRTGMGRGAVTFSLCRCMSAIAALVLSKAGKRKIVDEMLMYLKNGGITL